MNDNPDFDVDIPHGKTIAGTVAAPLALFGAYKLASTVVRKVRNRRRGAVVIDLPTDVEE